MLRNGQVMWRESLHLGLMSSCVVLTLVGGCRGENPAFESSGADGTQDESEQTTEPFEEGDDDPVPECAVDESDRIGGFIDLVPFCNTNEQDLYDDWFRVVGGEGSTWTVESCTMPNCEGCEDQITSPLTIAPLDIAAITSEGDCLHVTARRLPTDNLDSCDFHTIVVERDLGQGAGAAEPILIARMADNLDMPVVTAGQQVNNFQPAMEVDLECECDEFPDECCAEIGPTIWKYEVGGQDVFLDGTAELDLDGRSYEFWALDGYDSGECGEPRAIAWALYLL